MTADLYDLAGRAALGSRLRRLAARLADEAPPIYRLYGVDLDPRWFPVFYFLARSGPHPVGDVARAVGQSHAAVSQVVQAMRKQGLVTARRSPDDGRLRVVALTPRGEAVAARLEDQVEDVAGAVAELQGEAEHDIWEAVAELERLLDSASLPDRVRRQFRRNRKDRVEIEPMRRDDPQDAAAFERLNLAWIERFFRVEAADRAALGNPRKKILDPGGEVFLARLDDEVVGTAAMVPMPDGGFELAKMAVAPHVQGLGLGEDLARAALAWARDQGAPRVFLESNRSLTPARKLYEKLGFVEVAGPPSPYARADIQMELMLPRSAPARARRTRPRR